MSYTYDDDAARDEQQTLQNTVTFALLNALVDITPPTPREDASCHAGLVHQRRCSNCQRIASAHAAIQFAKVNGWMPLASPLNKSKDASLSQVGESAP